MSINKSIEITPKISIITPTYNRVDMLSEAIKSILSQDYTNWELIVIDNFSTDETEEVVNSFRDARIRFTKVPKTGSVAASRNVGIKLATGDWIAFLDSDDIWDPAKLSSLLPSIRDGYDFIYHPLSILNKEAPKLRRHFTHNLRIKKPVYFNLLMNGNVIALSSVVVKKHYLDCIGGMNESKELYALEDYDAWLRISLLTDNFYLVPKYLGSYRVHGGNISQGNTPEYVAQGLKDHLSKLNGSQRRRFDSLYTYKELTEKISRRDFKDIKRKVLFTIRYGRAKNSLKLLIRLAQTLIFSLVKYGNEGR